MPSWTPEQVVALAPDAASASAGQALAGPRDWVSFARSERAIWGLCQGSGKQPYQARVDLAEPAFKCSCPSRKFPCKHGLGLLLLFAKNPADFAGQPEPPWVAEWLAGRSERAEKKVEKAQAVADKPVDAEAQAKRAAQRESRVEDGVASCRLWLEDLVRRGLAAAQAAPAADFERLAARMVDAQAPGLAAQVRRVPELIASGAGWDVRTLDHLGRLHLLLQAAQRLKDLPAELAVDVRTALGWNQPKDEVLARPGVQDCWVVLGQAIEDEDRLKVRRTWLVGRATRRRALLLDFAAGLSPLPQSPAQGAEFDGELAFYPSGLPLRALVKAAGPPRSIARELGDAPDATVEESLRGYAAAIAANPWIPRWPLLIRDVRALQHGPGWALVDADGAALPLRPAFQAGLQLWRLLSESGGRPVTLLAEWDGHSALPLSGIDSRRQFDLAARWAS